MSDYCFQHVGMGYNHNTTVVTSSNAIQSIYRAQLHPAYRFTLWKYCTAWIRLDNCPEACTCQFSKSLPGPGPKIYLCNPILNFNLEIRVMSGYSLSCFNRALQWTGEYCCDLFVGKARTQCSGLTFPLII